MSVTTSMPATKNVPKKVRKKVLKKVRMNDPKKDLKEQARLKKVRRISSMKITRFFRWIVFKIRLFDSLRLHALKLHKLHSYKKMQQQRAMHKAALVIQQFMLISCGRMYWEGTKDLVQWDCKEDYDDIEPKSAPKRSTKTKRPEAPRRIVAEVVSGIADDFDDDLCAARVWMCNPKLSRDGDKDIPEQGEVRQCSRKKVGGCYCRAHAKRAADESVYDLTAKPPKRKNLYQGRWDEPFRPIRFDDDTKRWILLWNTPGNLFKQAVCEWIKEHGGDDEEPLDLYIPFKGSNGRFENGVLEFLLKQPIKLLSWSDTPKQIS